MALGLWLTVASIRQLRSAKPQKSFSVAVWATFIGQVFLGACFSIPVVHSAFDPSPFVLALIVSALFLVTRPILLMATALGGAAFLWAMLLFTAAPMDEAAVVIPLTLIIYTLAVAFRYQAQLRSSRAQEKLDQMSCLDMLTGVGNVTKLERDVPHMDPELMSVCLVDVDDFKGINDTHGHLTGNQVLRCVALSLEDAFRDMGNCYRVGGDEFVVLAQGVDTQQLALRLRQAQGYLSTRMAQLGLGDVVTMSAGVACAFDGGAVAGTEVAQVSAGATQVDETAVRTDAPRATAQAAATTRETAVPQAATAAQTQCAQARAAMAEAQPHAYYGGGYGTEVRTSAGNDLGTSLDDLVELNGPRHRRVSTAREIARLLDPPRYPTLLQLADKRLYQSKARGKACVTW